MSDTATAVVEREVKTSRSTGTANLITKLVIVGLIDALLVWALAQTVAAGWWPATVFFALALVAINLVYFTRGLPLKYLLPGLLFLIVYQLFTMLFTGYASLTNYGTGHLDDKAAAVVALEQSKVVPVVDAPEYPVVPIVKDDVVSMLVTDPTTGAVSIGTNESLTPVAPAAVQMDGTTAVGVAGYTSLNLGSLTANPDYQEQWNSLTVPYDEAEAQGIFLRAIAIRTATQAQSKLVYDEPRHDDQHRHWCGLRGERRDGLFVAADGQALSPVGACPSDSPTTHRC